jgi:hypothetical protein
MIGTAPVVIGGPSRGGCDEHQGIGTLAQRLDDEQVMPDDAVSTIEYFHYVATLLGIRRD